MKYLEIFKASVRPGLAWIFGVSICAGFFVGKVPLEALLSISGPVIGFYINSREKGKQANAS